MADDFNALLERASGSGSLPAPVVLNPLAATSSALQTAGSIYSLREKQAQEAAGQAYQGAINQETGEFDPNRFRTLLAQSGPAAMAAGAALLNTQNISSNQLEQNLAKAKWVNSAAGAALQTGDYSDGAMLKLFQTGIANGVITMPEVQRQIQLLPPDAAGRKRWLEEHQMTSASVQEQLQQRQGTQQTINTPQGTYVVNVPPISADKTVVVPHGVGPGETTTQKTWVYADGRPAPPGAPGASEQATEVHKSNIPGVPQGGPPQIVPATGGGGSGSSAPPIPPPAGSKVVIPGQYVPPGTTPPTAPAAPAASPTAPATPASPFGAGAFGGASTVVPAPTAPTAPATPPAATSPASAPAPGLVISTTVPSGVKEEQNLSATQWATDRAEAGNFQQRIWPMVQSYKLLTGGDVTTGKGAEFVSNVKSYLQTLGSVFTPADLQSIGQADFEKLGKYLQQAVNSNPFAGGSNDKLAAAISGNPNTHISTLANTDVVKAMIALERAKQAAVAEFQNSGQPASSWADFKSKWQTGHDPRVFATDMMDDKQVREMLTKMSPAEHAAYQRTLDLIKANPSIMNTAAMPGHAQAAPAAAPTRAYAMAQPQGNPLLAYA